MKSLNLFVKVGILALAFVAPALANATGEKAGNGGITVVCRDPQGKITSAKLLDLWEAENDSEALLQFERGNRSFQNELKRGLLAIANSSIELEYDTRHFLALVQKRILPLASSATTGIVLSTDFHPRFLPKGPCKFEAAAKVMSNGKIQLDAEIYNQLSTTDQAGLYLHEAIYAAARANISASDSDFTRIVVGQAMSKAPVTIDSRSVLDENADYLNDIPLFLLRGTGIISYSIFHQGNIVDAAYTVDANRGVTRGHHEEIFVGAQQLTSSFDSQDPGDYAFISLDVVKKYSRHPGPQWVEVNTWSDILSESRGVTERVERHHLIDFGQIANNVPFSYKIRMRAPYE